MQLSLLWLSLVLLLSSASGACCSAFLIPQSSTSPVLSIQGRLRCKAGAIDMTTTQPIKELTLLFVRRLNANGGKEILLGLKKRGFGKGKWNGFGGKVEKGETTAQAAMRELLEESRLKTETVVQKGRLVFTLDTEPEILRVHVFEAGPVEGTPEETEEMKPQWFSEDAVPYDNMWADDKYWLPLYLENKYFEGRFHFSDESTIINYDLKEVEMLSKLD